jgi:AcrR family transcriptional regulator
MRAEGLEGVTMRRLAAELDTGPASLYVYFQNTAELHAAILDELLGPVRLEGAVGPPVGGTTGSWEERVTHALWSYTGILVQHPGVARAALVSRPSGPNYLALAERLLRLLREGGVPDAQAVWGVDILLLFATAIALEHGTRHQGSGAEAEEEALERAIREADRNDYPTISELGSDLLSGSPKSRFDWHVLVLLNGIARTPRAPIDGEPREDRQ